MTFAAQWQYLLRACTELVLFTVYSVCVEVIKVFAKPRYIVHDVSDNILDNSTDTCWNDDRDTCTRLDQW